MDIGVISVRYTRALLKCAVSKKCEDAVYREMEVLAKSYLEVSDLRITLDNPTISKDRKTQLLVTACGGSPSGLTLSFIDLVLRERREDMLQFMANSYITLYRKLKNITMGKLVTAVAVTPETEQKMKSMVEKMTDGVVEFETKVDPSIVGGFILEYGTYRLDDSVKTRLRNILSHLTV